MSEPIASVYNSPKAVTGLYQKDGQLYATALDYAKNDAHCCPSIKTLYKVVLRKKAITLNKHDIRDVYTWDFLPVK